MFILIQVADSIGTITLNQPAKRNALSQALVEDVIAALVDFQKADVRAVVIRAAADAKVWSAGHDMNHRSCNDGFFGAMADAPPGQTHSTTRRNRENVRIIESPPGSAHFHDSSYSVLVLPKFRTRPTMSEAPASSMATSNAMR